jgi:hypothetical protein
MTDVLQNVALGAANTAIQSNRGVMETNAALGAVDPSLQKQFNQTIDANNLVGTIAPTSLAPTSSTPTSLGSASSALASSDEATAVGPDLGWVNGFRAWLAGRYVGLTYKQTYIDPIVESVTNNKVVVLSETIVKNAIADAAQSVAETLNLVKRNADGQYEKLLDLDPKVLDERIANLNNLLQDKTVQKDIGEAASKVVEAAQAPLEKAQKELVEISAKMVEDVSEQGALALGNALKVLPVVGNALSAANALQNITNVVASGADGAAKAFDVTKDLSTGVQLNLKEETVKRLLNDPTKQMQLAAAFEEYKNAVNDQIKITTREIEEEKNNDPSSSSDKNDILNEITKKEAEIKEYKTTLDEWSNNENIKTAVQKYSEKMSGLLDPPSLTSFEPQKIIDTNGGGKSRKRRAHSAHLTSKRISDCLKQHFSKTRCAPRKSHTRKKRKHIKHIKHVVR